MSYLLGAYAAAPTDPSSPEFGDFITALSGHELVAGLEVPSHHLADLAAVESMVQFASPQWVYAVTCFPGTVLAMANTPSAGLASMDSAGRSAAVEFVAGLREQIGRFDEQVGGGKVQHLFLHSAPRGGTPDALAVSLAEILSWDWNGTRLHLEHSDAAVPGQESQKGFLSLTDELTVLDQLGDVGLVINWGRSAIESRSVDGPVEHLERARAAGLLSGLMFSGAAESESEFGSAWLDAHLPTSSVEPTSLLTPAEITRSLRAAGDDVFLGVKVGVRPVKADVAQKVSAIDRVLQDIHSAATAER
jgi:hypothetical protein